MQINRQAFFAMFLLLLAIELRGDDGGGATEPLVRVVDLNLGKSADVVLANGSTVTVKLLELVERRDPIRDAVREARVHVAIDDQKLWLDSANYHLPKRVGNVQIDCPVTVGYTKNSSKQNAWGLVKDARLRLWPADSPWIRPGTFVYPVDQRWFASSTQMANEPCYVNACEDPDVRNIYYHYGLDFGGAERMVRVVAATDGLVVSARDDRLAGHDDSPVSPRYDVVYLLDDRGWYYRYSHFDTIDDTIRPGVRVRAGQPLGRLGKEGGSGGWSHLHFDVKCRQPSGMWGIQEAYAFVWQAYRQRFQPQLIANARPHQVALAGEPVTLDGSRSFSASGQIQTYRWSFGDGTTADGVRVEHTYDKPGYYSEVLEVTDSEGKSACDFAIVVVFDPTDMTRTPPAIHPVYYPTSDLRPGDEVTFKVRSFETTSGAEVWDFGDGTPPVRTASDGNANVHARDGYAIVTHSYSKPGGYLVRVHRANELGYQAVGHLYVRVESP